MIRACRDLTTSMLVTVVATIAMPAMAHAASPDSSTPQAPVASGPTVALERYEVSAGDEIDVSVAGFNSHAVTLVTCGNSANRGSADCAMVGAKSRELDAHGSRTASFTVEAPPVPCPCVIRAFSPGNAEVAVAPFTLIGHPTGPPIESPTQTLQLAASIVANPASSNAWRSFKAMLGGAAEFDVTLTVRNLSSIAVSNATARAWVGRNTDDSIREIDFPPVGNLAVGATWVQTVRVELPAATWGDVVWQAAVSGAGPTTTVQATSRNVPVLLFVLLGVLALDIVVLAVRAVIRFRRTRSGGRSDDPSDDPSRDSLDEQLSPDAERRPERLDDPVLVG